MNNTNIDVRIGGEAVFRMINDLKIRLSVNNHGTMVVKGIANSDFEVEHENMYKKIVEIELLLEEECFLFKGVIQEIEVLKNDRYREISIEAMTGTCLIDEELKSRSFQNIDETYAEVIKTLIKDIPGNGVIRTGGKQKIGKPLIQYKETDWEFIKRLAGLAGVAVVPELKSGLPQFWFGMREGKEKRKISEFTGKTMIHNQYKTEIAGKSNKISYVFQEKPGMEIGDKVVLNGREWIIYQIEGDLASGEMVFKYWLGDNQMGIQEKNFKTHYSGMSLKGYVEKTENEKIYIKLDIDRENGHGGYAYEYKPITGQIMYSMPEKGTAVSLHYLSADEREAVILDNKGWSEESITTNDSSQKRFQTDYDKSLFLFPSVMGLSSADQSGKMSRFMLADRDHILLESGMNIAITANGPVTMNASAIQVNVPLSIEIVQRG